MLVQGSAAMQFKSQTALKLKEQGNQLFAEHKFNEAIDLYTKALQVTSHTLLLCSCILVLETSTCKIHANTNTQNARTQSSHFWWSKKRLLLSPHGRGKTIMNAKLVKQASEIIVKVCSS
jgi:hypothetical protein